MLGVKAVELVIHAVTHALGRAAAEIVPAGDQCKLGRRAGIPDPLTPSRFAIRVEHVNDVKAVAGRAHRRAGRTRKAPAAELVPEGILVEGIHQHRNLLNAGDGLVEGLLARASSIAESTAVGIGCLTWVAGRLEDVCGLDAANRDEVALADVGQEQVVAAAHLIRIEEVAEARRSRQAADADNHVRRLMRVIVGVGIACILENQVEVVHRVDVAGMRAEKDARLDLKRIRSDATLLNAVLEQRLARRKIVLLERSQRRRVIEDNLVEALDWLEGEAFTLPDGRDNLVVAHKRLNEAWKFGCVNDSVKQVPTPSDGKTIVKGVGTLKTTNTAKGRE